MADKSKTKASKVPAYEIPEDVDVKAFAEASLNVFARDWNTPEEDEAWKDI